MSYNPLDSIWVEKYRPKVLADVLLPEHTRKILEGYRKTGEIPNLLLHGSTGNGKTSTAKVLCYDVMGLDPGDVLYINASDESGIDVIRGKITSFAMTMGFGGKHKVIILDEADGLTSSGGGSNSNKGGKTSAQSALRATMEEHASNVRFILTCNYLGRIIPPIQSRCVAIKFEAPSIKEVATLVMGILKKEGVMVATDQHQLLIPLIRRVYPDIRGVINTVHGSVIDGVLDINPNASVSGPMQIVQDIMDALRAKTSLPEIRAMWITRGTEFSNNYADLLRGLFLNIVHDASIGDGDKRNAITILNTAIYRHHIVMDTEINVFGAVVELSGVITA